MHKIILQHNQNKQYIFFWVINSFHSYYIYFNYETNKYGVYACLNQILAPNIIQNSMIKRWEKKFLQKDTKLEDIASNCD